MCSSLLAEPQRPEQRLEQGRDGGLADPAQAQRGHGDAELAGGEIGLEMLEDAQRQARRACCPARPGPRAGWRGP